MSAKKGSGTTINAVLIVIALLIFFYIFLAASANTSQKKLELNLNTADFMKTKNSVSILNRSLSATWFVSTAQLIFRAGDESLGCGFDDVLQYQKDIDEVNRNEITDKGYWYQYDKLTEAKAADPKQFEPDDRGAPKKYNFKTKPGGLIEPTEPRICYPQDGHFLEFFGAKAGLYRQIPAAFTLNGISFSVDVKKFEATKFEDDKVVSTAEQEIRANIARATPSIITTTTSASTIFTGFRKMMAAGRRIVENAIEDSKATQPGARAGDLNYRALDDRRGGDTAASYKKRVEGHLKKRFSTDLASIIPPASFATSADIELRVRAAEGSEKGIGFQQAQQGLVMGYDADVRISERGTTIAPSAGCDVSSFAQFIDSAVGEWKFKDTDPQLSFIPWITTKFEYSKDEIRPLVVAIIQQESSCRPEVVSCAGAVGLMQLMPGTAREQGLHVPIETYGKEKLVCFGTETEHDGNKCNDKTVDTVCDKSSDERFDPEKNVRGGVKYLRFLFETLKEHTREKEELIKLVIAAYNAGHGGVKKAIDKAGVDKNTVRYSQIEAHLPPQTQEYVKKVMSLYTAGGGAITTDDYYYHDEKHNQFYPRPFSLSLKVKDHLNILDCNELPQSQFYKPYGWQSAGDMVCCGGAVWTCGVQATEENNLGGHALQNDDDVPDEAPGIDCPQGKTCPGKTCRTSLSNNRGQGDWTLGCRGGAFKEICTGNCPSSGD